MLTTGAVVAELAIRLSHFPEALKRYPPDLMTPTALKSAIPSASVVRLTVAQTFPPAGGVRVGSMKIALSPLLPASEVGALEPLPITLDVNGERRQQSTLDQLIWDVPEILHELSKLYALRAGDVVFMGTPAGVAALQPGDAFAARIGDALALHGHVVRGNG